MSTPESAGWYDDPEDDSRLRYFDGIIWSDRTVPRQARSAQPTPSSEPVSSQHGPGTDVFGRPTGHIGQPTQPGPAGWGAPHQQPWGPPASTAEPTTVDGQPLAGYGARAGAYLIDLVILGLLNLLVSGWAWYLWMADYVTYVWDAALAGNQDAVNELTPEQLLGFFSWQYFFVAVGLSLLLQTAYHVGFLATRNATPGKMMLGLSVRRVDQPGRLGVGTAFMRLLLPLTVGVFSVVPLLSYLVWFVSVADLLWPIKDERRQALHDKIAGTQVVKGKQPRGTLTQES
ncbi:RDD family protein [Janibacter sp. GS2]|uniref:RDD family protein n=1 Tax=Janibacter sp. GS2 TaxID=3442646 RepID=UPI003EBC4E4E